MEKDIFVAHGTCMEPAIHDMEPFLVRPLKSRPRNNEVVLICKEFPNGRVYFPHRIYFRTRIGDCVYFVHKGDNSTRWGFASEKQITHKAVLNRPPQVQGLLSLFVAFMILQIARPICLVVGDCEELMKAMRKSYKFLTGYRKTVVFSRIFGR